VMQQCFPKLGAAGAELEACGDLIGPVPRAVK
jgi:hypothetical protein